MVYQLWRTKGLSTQEWKYPPDVINWCIINPVLCLGPIGWLHASVTLSNPRVSRRKKPWNIFLGMVSDACHEIFIIWEQSHNRGGGSMQGFDLQKPRRLNQVDRFLPSPVVTHKFTFTSVSWMNSTKPSVIHWLLTYRYKLITASAELQFYGPVYYTESILPTTMRLTVDTELSFSFAAQNCNLYLVAIQVLKLCFCFS